MMAIEAYASKSFEGEILVAATQIRIKNRNELEGHICYYDKRFNISHSKYLRAEYKEILNVHFDIHFDEGFYQKIRLMHDNTSVQFEGKVLKFKRYAFERNYRINSDPFFEYYNVNHYSFELSLTYINIINKSGCNFYELSAEVLDNKYRLLK